jgi:hypothetical protein
MPEPLIVYPNSGLAPSLTYKYITRVEVPKSNLVLKTVNFTSNLFKHMQRHELFWSYARATYSGSQL